MANFKFPTPESCKLKDRAVLCPAERILDLFNQNHTKPAQRISKRVKTWFVGEAIEHEWAGANFIPNVQSGHGAGCVLFVPPQQLNISVEVKKTTLVLEAESGNE